MKNQDQSDQAMKLLIQAIENQICCKDEKMIKFCKENNMENDLKDSKINNNETLTYKEVCELYFYKTQKLATSNLDKILKETDDKENCKNLENVQDKKQ